MITKIDYDRLNHVHAIYLDNGQVLHDIIKVDSPVSNIGKNKTVKKGTKVELISDNAIIYTDDGTIPTYNNGILYKKPIVIERPVTIKAISIAEGLLSSTIETFYYDIGE